MSAYSDLKQISIEYAVTALADLAVPRGTRGKVLLVPIRFTAENFDKDFRVCREITMVVFRPMNYCFVGMVEGHHSSLDEEQDVHYETYHDSCWRDGINRMVRDVTSPMYDAAEEADATKKLHVFNSFGIFEPRVIDGNIQMNDDDRTAKFRKIKEHADNA